MAKSDAIILWTVIIIIFFINIAVPIISIGFGQDYVEYDTDLEITSPPTIGDYFGIGALSILLIPFWTLGMPLYLNLSIMIPLRILAWILILRMIRGN